MLKYKNMKIYGVFGLGKSGIATVNYLLGRGDTVFAWDDGEDARGNLKCTPIANWDWAKIDALILSPGIALHFPQPHDVVKLARQHGKRIICDIELLWEDNRNAKFIGITGTNGKSTTTALLAHILQQAGLDMAVGGNLGTAALTLGKHEFYVLETSSYQLDLIDNTKFDIAIWLNISPDHIDRHGSLEGYIEAKKRIFKNGNTTRIVGIDDEYSAKVCKEQLTHPVLDTGSPQKISAIQVRDVVPISRSNSLGNFPNLPGEHNMQNINAAYEAAKALGVPHDTIIAAIHSFGGLKHRMELVATINGVKYVNDSKATNADSAMWALKTFDDIYWIIGGVPKAGGIESLAKFFPKICKAYIIGQATDEFAKTLEGKVAFEKCGDLQNAVAKAGLDAKTGVVLLSPACASFDQFKSYEHRGDVFRQLVSNLMR